MSICVFWFPVQLLHPPRWSGHWAVVDAGLKFLFSLKILEFSKNWFACFFLFFFFNFCLFHYFLTLNTPSVFFLQFLLLHFF